MQDRLRELKGAGGSTEGASTSHEDIELGVIKGNEQVEGEFMNDFFQEVGLIKGSMSNIRRSIKQIEEKYIQSLNSISVDQGNKSGNEIQQLIDTTNVSVTEVRAKLENMKKNNAAFANSKGASPTEIRIRTNMQGTLTQKFLELVQEYQEVQTSYKNKYKEKIERQYKIAKPDASQDEIEEAMSTGDSSKIFANQILDTHLHAQAKSALAYIEARHKDILRLEASIAELHQMFVDMAVLVETQGELLNQIEYNVNQSVAYTKQGVEELRSANKYQRRSRKKMYILLVILIVIIIAVLAPTLSTVIKKKPDA
jgi:syntaxin 1B/2/3